MNKIMTQIESLLFMAGKPLSIRKMADILLVKPKEIIDATEALMQSYKEAPRGVHIMKVDQQYQMATAPDNSELIEGFIKSEQTGELTKPSLETLTIVTYRGPITKAELEQIRGVNCSLILRNLLIRGLIEAKFDKSLSLTTYQVTMSFLEFLGVSRVEELPEYEKLHDDVRLKQLLEQEKIREEEQAMKSDIPDKKDE